jgi:hypothetical protein
MPFLKTAAGNLIELTGAVITRSNLGTPMVTSPRGTLEICSNRDADRVQAAIEVAITCGAPLISVPRILQEIAEAPDKLHGGENR